MSTHLQHPLGDEDLVEVLVVGPDPLVGGLVPAPPSRVVPDRENI